MSSRLAFGFGVGLLEGCEDDDVADVDVAADLEADLVAELVARLKVFVPFMPLGNALADTRG
jgi:hypothetical protein